MTTKQKTETVVTLNYAEWQNGKWEQTENEEHLVEFELPIFPAGTPVCKVRSSLGAKLNMGNYESVEVRCEIEVPCVAEQVDVVQEKSFEFLKKVINDAAGEVRQAADSRKAGK